MIADVLYFLKTSTDFILEHFRQMQPIKLIEYVKCTKYLVSYHRKSRRKEDKRQASPITHFLVNM